MIDDSVPAIHDLRFTIHDSQLFIDKSPSRGIQAALLFHLPQQESPK
jgi:hypothetical protein